QNLLANAIKFADREHPVVVVRAQPTDDDGWTLTVEDNGPGIAEHDQQRIFGAFERAARSADEDGYGLGLAIATRLVERHGGRIGVESAPGTGSRFSVTLRSGPAAPGSVS